MKVIMPQLGETVDKGTIIRWHKKEGATIEKNEPLFEVETDKVTMEIPSQQAGVLKNIYVLEGQTVPIGYCVAEIENNDDSICYEKLPKEANATQNNKQTQSDARSQNHVLSPAVNRLLKQHHITPASISGTGKGGRITREDVNSYIKTLNNQPKMTNMQSNLDTTWKERFHITEYETVPFNSMRKTIATHMVQSKKISPHVSQAIEVNMSQVIAIKNHLRENCHQKQRAIIGLLPIIMVPLIKALQQYPKINSWIENDSLIIHKNINIGLAIDLQFNGLVVPVMKAVQACHFIDFAIQMDTIIQSAKENRLAPDDFIDGTFTISNIGSFGTLFTTPIINQPQVAILSIDGMHRKPYVVSEKGQEKISIENIGTFVLSFDHRAFDGAYSAAFLKYIKQSIESLSLKDFEIEQLDEVN